MMRCKLQMMRSAAVGNGWRLGPMLAAGLTLRHYRSFEECSTLAALKQRIARESPWFDRYGIHVLVSQNSEGELTLGDSHEYNDSVDPFDKIEIDELILGYLRTFLHAPELRIASRWHGVYAKHPDDSVVACTSHAAGDRRHRSGWRGHDSIIRHCRTGCDPGTGRNRNLTLNLDRKTQCPSSLLSLTWPVRP